MLSELERLLAFLEISSDTNEVAILNNAILKNFDRVLKIATQMSSMLAPGHL
jgi:hypothetical protein